MLKKFQCWDGELDFIDSMLHSDVRNNSAWNQRWYVICATNPMPLEEPVVKRELAYALENAAVATKNTAPWAYVRGLLRGRRYDDFPEVQQAVESLLAEADSESPALVGVLVDIYEQRISC